MAHTIKPVPFTQYRYSLEDCNTASLVDETLQYQFFTNIQNYQSPRILENGQYYTIPFEGQHDFSSTNNEMYSHQNLYAPYSDIAMNDFPSSFEIFKQEHHMHSPSASSSTTNHTAVVLSHMKKERKRSSASKSSSQQQQHQLPENALNILGDWYQRNHEKPYPTQVEKKLLAERCNITDKQVNAWFCNRRNRSNNTKPKRIKKQLTGKIDALLDKIIDEPDKSQSFVNEIRKILNEVEPM